MKRTLHLLCLVIGALMMCSEGWAQEMNKSYVATENGFSFGGSWGDIKISSSYFLSDAIEVRLRVKNAQQVIFRCDGTEVKTYKLYNGEELDVTYVVKGDELIAARNGKFSATASTSEAILIVTNMDAQGLEDEKNNQGGSTGGDTGGDSDDGGNTGGGTSTKTLAEKIADREQLTNLPTIYFTVPAAEGKDINTVLYKDRTNNIAPYCQTTIQVVDNGQDGTNRPLGNYTEAGLEIKVRGNSTAEMDKRPYRLRFYKDETGADGSVTSHKHDMLGYGYSKRNWTILNNMKDGSLMQNAITYYIGQAVGMPFCPGYKFVDLVINGEYRGNYMLSDHVELGSHRIDIDEDTGWFVESTRNDMVEEPYVLAGQLYVLIKKPESKVESETTAIKNEVAEYFDYINNYIFGINKDGCDNVSFCHPVRGWRSVFDEESLVRFYVGLELTGDSDGMMQVKMYRTPDGKMFFGPLWDKDLAFGVQDDGKTLAEGNGTDFGAPTFGNYVKKIMKTDPVFVKKVHDKLHAVLDAGYVNNIIAEIDKLETLLTQSKTLEYNNTGWKAVSVENYPVAVERLRQYIKDHTSWFTTLIDERYEAMGGNSIVDNTMNYDEPEFEEEFVSGIVFSGWNARPLYAGLIKPNATSAEIIVKNATSIVIQRGSDRNDKSLIIKDFGSKDENKTGVSYTLEGTDLELAKQGKIYLFIPPSDDVVLSVINHGTEEPIPATRQQLTNLPTIYLDATVGNDWSTASLEVFDQDNKLTQGTSWTSTAVSVQYQGGHSEGTKDSYRLKFDSKTKLLSSGKFKQWVLASNDDDPSMINNAMAKELGDLVGMPFTPGYQFVDLYLNNTYMGTYQVTDRIKTESGRALVTGGDKDNDWHVRINDNDEIAEGGYATTKYIAATASKPNIVIKNPDPDDFTDATALETLKYQMDAWFSTFFTKDADGHYSSVASNVDKQQLINWYICQEVMAIYKGLSSVEAYRSVAATDQVLHFGPLWDNETAFGNRGDEDGALSMADLNTTGSYNGLIFKYNKYGLMKSFIEDLWTQEWFKAGVPAKWNALVEAGLLNTLKSKASAISATLSQSQPKNLEKWTNSLKTKYNTYNSYSAAVAAISTYLDKRVPYLTTKFTELGATCTNHTYANYVYVSNGDGTYSLSCDNCGAADTSVKTHRFTVYHQHGVKEDVYKDTWTRNANTNDVATIEKAAGVSGENIIQIDGKNYTCEKFVLTDGQPFYYTGEKSFTAVEAIYTRSVKNAWGTICLPFKMQSASTDYADFYHLKSLSDDGATMVFELINPESGAGAYKPMVFKAKNIPEGGTADMVISGTNITVKATTVTNSNSTVDGWTLYGTVEKYVIDDVKVDASLNGKSLYYISNNQFWLATKKYTNNPYRAYFVNDAASSDGSVKTFSINVADEQATSVENVDDINSTAIFVEKGGVSIWSPINTDINIYASNGSLVKVVNASAGITASVTLPSGIYVINGVKFIIK